MNFTGPISIFTQANEEILDKVDNTIHNQQLMLVEYTVPDTITSKIT